MKIKVKFVCSTINAVCCLLVKLALKYNKYFNLIATCRSSKAESNEDKEWKCGKIYTYSCVRQPIRAQTNPVLTNRLPMGKRDIVNGAIEIGKVLAAPSTFVYLSFYDMTAIGRNHDVLGSSMDRLFFLVFVTWVLMRGFGKCVKEYYQSRSWGSRHGPILSIR